MKIFPKEILENTAEVFQFKHTTRSKIIYSVFLTAILAALIALPFIKIDVYTSSAGLIKPNQERVPLSIINSGRVKFSIVEDNLEVKEGDTILIIENKIIDEQLRYSDNEAEEMRMFLTDLEYLVAQDSPDITAVKSRKYRINYLEYEQKLKELQTRLAQKRMSFERNQKLYNKGIIASAEFEIIKSEFQISQSNVSSLIKQQRNSWQSDLINYQDALEELLSNQSRLTENKSQYYLTAPASGTLMNATQLEQGSFVVQGSRIAEISPDTDLIAECYISPADIGLIDPEKKVIFQIDAYNYNQWGLADGEILEISKDIIMLENTPVFKIRCLLNQDQLQLKNGVVGKIKKGMTLNARFILAERSLFDLLYDSVDDWLNPAQV